mgnify:CR=1 FL=1
MKLQNETITILSIKDISNELNDKESESWNKLSHVLTHEIMNTIAPIISLSQTLSAYPDNSEKTLRGLHIIQAQSERLLEFTESFRRLSYLPQPERKRFSLTASCKICKNSCLPIFRKIRFISHLPVSRNSSTWMETRTSYPKSCSISLETPFRR